MRFDSVRVNDTLGPIALRFLALGQRAPGGLVRGSVTDLAQTLGTTKDKLNRALDLLASANLVTNHLGAIGREVRKLVVHPHDPQVWIASGSLRFWARTADVPLRRQTGAGRVA